MSESPSERHLAENEVVFRAYNERIKKGFDELKKIAKEDNQEEHIVEDDNPLQFYCECSSVNCNERVKLKPSRYNKIHKQRDRFVVICGHENKNIERVVAKETEFFIVEKYLPPPKPAQVLKKRDR